MNKDFFHEMDFNESPFIVLWELTRACDLVCKHCRADAQVFRTPMELKTQECFDLLDEIRSFHPTAPLLIVLTGGDPQKRPDLLEIIRYGASLGLRMTVTPSGTPSVQRQDLEQMKESGLARVAVSLDGSNAKIHDAFRGVAGSFQWSLQILRWARECGLETQVNTTVTRYNLDDFDHIGALCKELKISLWSVFFLVPTGRGERQDLVSAQDFEGVFEKMEALSREKNFDIKSTAAPQYRRVVIQKRLERKERHEKGLTDVGFQAFQEGNRSRKGVNDANGILFVSHTGEIYPSGFLPLSAGNVRTHRLVDIYRHSELFRSLRDYSRLEGKCGVCEYKSVCGGSRARAYALEGDLHASDPYCVYIPRRYCQNPNEHPVPERP